VHGVADPQRRQQKMPVRSGRAKSMPELCPAAASRTSAIFTMCKLDDLSLRRKASEDVTDMAAIAILM
jgi:hypothetical protein